MRSLALIDCDGRTMATARTDLISAAKVERLIVYLRGQGVILDNDLARLYGVPTKALVQAVNRNRSRFPPDFMFQLTAVEFHFLRSQFVTSKGSGSGGRRYRPYAFTEQGVAMLSSVLRSRRAVAANIEIMRAFVRLRRLVMARAELERKLNALERKYDTRFKVIFDAIRKLMAPPTAKSKPIGFQPASFEDHIAFVATLSSRRLSAGPGYQERQGRPARLFFLPDLPRALSEIRRVLKPGGRVGVIVFSMPDKNPFFSVPISIIRRRAQLGPPLPGQPGPFSLGAPGVLANALAHAGFADVQTQAVSAPLRMASARECVRFERESFGALRRMLAGLTETAREETWQEVERELEKYEGRDGFESPCEVIVGGGVK